MIRRSATPHTFFRDPSYASAGIPTRSLARTRTLAQGEYLVLGPGEGSDRTITDHPAAGKVVDITAFSVTNIVVTNSDDPDGSTLVAVANSLEEALTTQDVAAALPRVPAYFSAHEAQKVVANLTAGPAPVTVAWEETGLPSFINGGHPGAGKMTLALGELDPAVIGADGPYYFRVNPGRGFVVEEAHVYSVSPVVVTGGDAELQVRRSDGTLVTVADDVDLEAVTPETLEAVPLKADEADRTIASDQWLDLVVECGASVGTPGDLCVELTYRLL